MVTPPPPGEWAPKFNPKPVERHDPTWRERWLWEAEDGAVVIKLPLVLGVLGLVLGAVLMGC